MSNDTPNGLDPKHVFDPLFWADVENDPCLKDCSMGAQGFWMTRMLPICARAKRRGYLLHNGAAPTIEQLVKWSGQKAEDITSWIEELGRKGVYSVTEDGIIYNRRIVRQELKKAATDKPTLTEKQLADKAIEAMLVQEAKEAERKAKQRARKNKSRAAKREADARAKMEAFDAMAAATEASDARAASRDTPVDSHGTGPLGHSGTPVTLFEVHQQVSPVTPPLDIQIQNPSLRDTGKIEGRSDVRPLAVDDGGRTLRPKEGQGARALQARVARSVMLPLLQSPNETDEAFAARKAARALEAA